MGINIFFLQNCSTPLLFTGFFIFIFACGQGYHDHADKVEFSGPLLSQSHRVDELLEKHERHIRQAVRRSWFQRGIPEQISLVLAVIHCAYPVQVILVPFVFNHRVLHYLTFSLSVHSIRSRFWQSDFIATKKA